MPVKRYEKDLEKIINNNSYRILRETVKYGKNLVYQGKKYLNLSSNDYLGISSDFEIWNSFIKNPQWYFLKVHLIIIFSITPFSMLGGYIVKRVK